MDFANLLSGCNPISGAKPPNSYLNMNCFGPPTAPLSFTGCAPNSFPNAPQGPPSGMRYCSNVLGNSGRNRFYGPKLTTVDFSIFKNTHIPAITETFNLQFRAEFFNILNHTNFLSPGFLNTFGQNNSVFDSDGSSFCPSISNCQTALNQTSTTSRQIQLGLKVIW